jgi:hypothetical protein
MGHFCPITGLSVVVKPEWQRQQLSATYQANFSIVGRSAIYSAPSGFLNAKDLQKAISLLEEVISKSFDKNARIVLIEDLVCLKRSTLEARKKFIEYMISNKRYVALIFCNASPLFKLAIKIGKRFNTTTREAIITNHYAEAIEQALQVCDKHTLDVGSFVFGEKARFHTAERSLLPVKLLTHNNWTIQTDEYSNRSMVIDGHILYSVSEGDFRNKHVSLAERLRDDVHAAISKGPGVNYFLLNASRLSGGSHRARQAYMRSLKNWHQRFPIRMYVLFGTNKLMKTAVSIAQPFMPFKNC